MRATLDQLLDATGISDIGGGLKKEASKKLDFQKLADRCRKAAEAPSPPVKDVSRDAALVEKTAEVAVIAKTMAEISSILGGTEKTAAATEKTQNVAAFIKAALDQGHRPGDVAAFLEKQGAMGHWLQRAAMFPGRVIGRAAKGVAEARGAGQLGGEASLLRSIWSTKGMPEQGKAIERLRKLHGDAGALKVLETAGVNFNHLNEGRHLTKTLASAAEAAAPAAAKPLVSGKIGNTEFNIQKKHLGPAAMIGGGALGYRALAGDDGEHKSKKSGVVVINR